MTKQFESKVALVTRGNSGIGVAGGRFGQPEEVAAATLWLCSAGASFVTGHAHLIDGGRLI